jgi:hypothetical protein
MYSVAYSGRAQSSVALATITPSSPVSITHVVFNNNKTNVGTVAQRLTIGRSTGGATATTQTPEKFNPNIAASGTTATIDWTTAPTVTALIIMGATQTGSAGPFTSGEKWWDNPDPLHPPIFSGDVTLTALTAADLDNTCLTVQYAEPELGYPSGPRGRRNTRNGYYHHQDFVTGCAASTAVPTIRRLSREFRIVQSRDWVSQKPSAPYAAIWDLLNAGDNRFGTALMCGIGILVDLGTKTGLSQSVLSAMALELETGKKAASGTAVEIAIGAIRDTGAKGGTAASRLVAFGTEFDTGKKSASGTATLSAIATIRNTFQKSATNVTRMVVGGIEFITGKKSSTQASRLSGIGTIVDTGIKTARSSVNLPGIATIIDSGAKAAKSTANLLPGVSIVLNPRSFSRTGTAISVGFGNILASGKKTIAQTTSLGAIGTVRDAGLKATSGTAKIGAIGAGAVLVRKMAT